MKTLIIFTIMLGVFSLFAGVATHLVLTDIYHGESDVTLEWNIVRLCAVVLLAFLGTALFTLARALRTFA